MYIKQGQTVHKTATERKTDKEANIQTSTQIHRHRYRKNAQRKISRQQRTRNQVRDGSKKKAEDDDFKKKIRKIRKNEPKYLCN